MMNLNNVNIIFNNIIDIAGQNKIDHYRDISIMNDVKKMWIDIDHNVNNIW